MEGVKIPTYSEMIDPLLQFLASKNKPIRTSEVYESLAEVIGLTEEAKREMLPSGTQPVYKNRIGWAHDALKRNGLSSSPRYGRWQITDEGKALLDKFSGSLPKEQSRLISMRNRNTPLTELFSKGATEIQESDQDTLVKSPEEKIDEGLQEISASVARELHEFVMRGTPEFFEQLVLDLLHAMGYGTDRKSLQRVGGSGDGGIDGIISLDRLGLEKVYVQAKRWKGQVGSPEIQGFVGALQLHGANKGVLITSGSVSKPARESASRANVVLIDGERLTNLMIENGVGVSSRSVRIPKLDSDYFEE